MQRIINDNYLQLHKLTLIFGVVICTFALIITGLGIWLVYLKSVGTTKFNLFEQEFFSDNIGIAAIFIGSVAFILASRRTLRSIDKMSDNYSKITETNINSGR